MFFDTFLITVFRELCKVWGVGGDTKTIWTKRIIEGLMDYSCHRVTADVLLSPPDRASLT